jgi:hypothetical protein
MTPIESRAKPDNGPTTVWITPPDEDVHDPLVETGEVGPLHVMTSHDAGDLGHLDIAEIRSKLTMTVPN